MVWKPAPLFLYLPCTSLPAMVTSYTSPWSTSCMNLENEISASLFPVPPAFTTCHKSTPESRITSQKTIVLIGFDTQELPSWNAEDYSCVRSGRFCNGAGRVPIAASQFPPCDTQEVG